METFNAIDRCYLLFLESKGDNTKLYKLAKSNAKRIKSEQKLFIRYECAKKLKLYHIALAYIERYIELTKNYDKINLLRQVKLQIM